MYNGWFGLEGPFLVDQLNKKPKPIMWLSGESDASDDSSPYTTTAIFTFPQLGKDRTVLGGVRFDPVYLKQKFFPEILEESTSLKLNDDTGQNETQSFYELTSQGLKEHEEQRLAMLVYPMDALNRPLAMSAGWNGRCGAFLNSTAISVTRRGSRFPARM